MAESVRRQCRDCGQAHESGAEALACDGRIGRLLRENERLKTRLTTQASRLESMRRRIDQHDNAGGKAIEKSLRVRQLVEANEKLKKELREATLTRMSEQAERLGLE